MSDTTSVLEFYIQRVTQFENKAAAVRKRRAGIAWIRFSVVLLTGFVVYITRHSELWLIITEIICGIAAFLYVVSIDTNSRKELENLLRLAQINKDEIDIINNRYHHRDNGRQYETPHHPYVQDLDIFGDASLYQYINRCNAQQSKQLLAFKLSNPSATQEIRLQQQAAKDLSPRTEWRQQFQSIGIEEPITTATEQKIKQWLDDKETVFAARYLSGL